MFGATLALHGITETQRAEYNETGSHKNCGICDAVIRARFEGWLYTQRASEWNPRIPLAPSFGGLRC